MSKRAVDFVERWVRKNINAEGFVGEQGDERPGRFAAKCLADAAKAGISAEEIDEDFPDLEDHMSEAIEAINSAEVDRLRTQEPS